MQKKKSVISASLLFWFISNKVIVGCYVIFKQKFIFESTWIQKKKKKERVDRSLNYVPAKEVFLKRYLQYSNYNLSRLPCFRNHLLLWKCLIQWAKQATFPEKFHQITLRPMAPCVSLRSCIFGFPASLLHPDMFISNCPSPFTTCFYQLFPQSATKQREESFGCLCAKGRGSSTATNIVHELLLISIPQCYRQAVLSICRGRGRGINRRRNALGRKYCSAMTQK